MLSEKEQGSEVCVQYAVFWNKEEDICAYICIPANGRLYKKLSDYEKAGKITL